MKHLKKILALLLAFTMLLNLQIVVHAADSTENWVSTWGTSEEKCDINADRMPQMALNGTTVRQIIRVTTSGDLMKLKFSNQYGNSDVVIRSLHIAKQVRADRSTIDLSTDTVVTVGGQEEFTIKAGKTIETDPVAFHVDALDNIAVSAYFGSAPTSNITGHRGARATTYQISGNNVSTETFNTSQTKTTTSWFFLCDVALDMPAGSKAVVCFGDSITDGYGTDADYLGKKPDSYTRWGDYFAKRLQANDATKNISVINEGIGSNSLLGSYPTDAGKDRFARDLLEHDGVGYLIIHFGVNDLQKLSNTNKYNQMITEFKKMIDLAHENDILVYVAPILPFAGSSDYYSAASEQVRTMINSWFNSPEAEVDAIIDFEGAVVDPSRPTYLRSEYTHSDGLHPYDGYSAMADAIDLSLFTADGRCEHEYTAEVHAPSCLESGYTQYVCAKCGNTRKGETTAPLGHDWDEGTITTAPTETTPGVLTIHCTRCDATKTKRIPRIGATVPDDIDFTDPASADRFEVVNQSATAIRSGQGLYLITTKDGFEPANDQLTGSAATTPKDLVLIPVEGDWAATMEFDFSQGSASNGYYQFFGFYAMQDYNNAAGIRGGNGAMQNFLRVGGSITADSSDLNSAPGLGSNGTYWYRLVKEGTTYTCLRSADGDEFTEMFSYEDTGIDADKIAIDAYTGMTEGYQFFVKSLKFEDVGGEQPHVHAYTTAVTAPTCTEAGFTTYTCACGESYVADEVAALGHDVKETKVDATCTAAGSVTKTCSRCDYQEVTAIAALGHDLKETKVDATCTAAGSITKACTRCDYQEVTTIAALGHDLKETKVDATCTAAGSVTKTCARCDYQEVTAIAALGHDLKETKVDATCTADGSVTKACERCDYEEVTVIPALGHDYVNGKCTVCGEKNPDYRCDGGENCPAKAFTDAPKAGNWAHAGIDYCIENNLMNGVSETIFRPNGTVTRGQLVTILYRIAGQPAFTAENSFTDVKPGKFYTNAVIWAAENEIVNGYAGNIFKPDAEISREQIATILYRYAGSPAVTGTLDFPDANKVGGYAVNALIWATQEGLINGISSNNVTTLSPKANATRAQIAAIIMRYLES